jgi:flagellar assembly factor FliW
MIESDRAGRGASRVPVIRNGAKIREVPMKVNTKAYGVIEVDDRQRIRFPFGLLGFEKFKEYVLLDARQQPFYYLQSLDVPEVAFVLLDPFLFKPDYSPDIDDEELAAIGVERAEDALVFSIVTIPDDGSPMTANLMGPVVINRANRLARQTVLGGELWKTKHDIMSELAASRKSTC